MNENSRTKTKFTRNLGLIMILLTSSLLVVYGIVKNDIKTTIFYSICVLWFFFLILLNSKNHFRNFVEIKKYEILGVPYIIMGLCIYMIELIFEVRTGSIILGAAFLIIGALMTIFNSIPENSKY